MLDALQIDELDLAAPVSDGRLLDRFIHERDQCAFEEIVRRHGLMVLGVCQRVLDNRHDAEDCFQAVFMVLVRKAATIVPREMVGNWLYGVAYRTALEARKLSARRRNLEKKKITMPQSDSANELWQEMRPILDKELNKLPDKYRFVLLACDLEGKTRKVVADELGLPEGTVASRLARGRAILAKRLQRYSLMVSPVFLADLLAENGKAMFLPETLISSVVGHAASVPSGGTLAACPTSKAAKLADAVLAGMLWTKIKIAVATACVAVLLGAGAIALLPSANAELNKQDGVAPKKQKPLIISDCVLRKVGKETIETMQIDENNCADINQVPLKPATRIVIDGRESKLSDLRPNQIVDLKVRLGADGAADSIDVHVQGEAVSGIVQMIPDGAITLRIDRVAMAVGAEDKYPLDPAVKVVIGGKKSNLADLKEGMRVTAQVSTPPNRRVMTIVGKE
jgi:RNA polymerase sigma factor (sigma-70 family)